MEVGFKNIHVDYSFESGLVLKYVSCCQVNDFW